MRVAGPSMVDRTDYGRYAGGLLFIVGALAIVQFFGLLFLSLIPYSFPYWWGGYGPTPSEFFFFPFQMFGVFAVLALVTAVLAIVGGVRAMEEPHDAVAVLGGVFGLLVIPPFGTILSIVALVLLVAGEAPEPTPQATGTASAGGGGTRATDPQRAAQEPARPVRPEPPAREDLRVGTVFRDRYRVEEHLGTGGMGRTFRAQDTVIGRQVVLKELLPHLRKDDQHLRAFLREARVAGGMDHRHIVHLYDVVDTGGGTVLVLEYVDGGSLADRLHEGTLELDEAVRILDQVLEALSALHEEGIWHRDVKPENVLLTSDGRVKLADFGIAHVPGGETLVTGSHPGTVRTMAPEQITGSEVDGRADLYACAALLYDMLVGEPYLDFEGRSLYEAQRAVVEEPPKLPVDDLPDEVNDLLAKGLAKAPSERFADADAMREALGSFTDAP